jgi:hypothetical protein
MAKTPLVSYGSFLKEDFRIDADERVVDSGSESLFSQKIQQNLFSSREPRLPL